MDISAIYKHPEDVVAVTSSSGSITYGELYRRSENLAKHIIASGAKRVIVYGHKEYSMVLAYVACLRAACRIFRSARSSRSAAARRLHRRRTQA